MHLIPRYYDVVNVLFLGLPATTLQPAGLHGPRHITAGLERLILFLYPTIVAIISLVCLCKKLTTAPASSRWCSPISASRSRTGHDIETSDDFTPVLKGGGLHLPLHHHLCDLHRGSGQMVGRIGATRLAALATTGRGRSAC